MENVSSNEAEQPAAEVDAVCDRCDLPAIQVDGVWKHAEVADSAFCALVFPFGGAK